MTARKGLDDHLPYLLNRAGGRYAAVFAQVLRKVGLRYSGWRVLHTVWSCGPLTLNDISQFANFDLSTLSRLVGGLEEEELVERLDPTGRGNRRPIGLTSRGRRLVESLVSADEACTSRLTASFTVDERNLLVALLNKMHGNLTYFSESESEITA